MNNVNARRISSVSLAILVSALAVFVIIGLDERPPAGENAPSSERAMAAVRPATQSPAAPSLPAPAVSRHEVTLGDKVLDLGPVIRRT